MGPGMSHRDQECHTGTKNVTPGSMDDPYTPGSMDGPYTPGTMGGMYTPGTMGGMYTRWDTPLCTPGGIPRYVHPAMYTLYIHHCTTLGIPSPVHPWVHRCQCPDGVPVKSAWALF